MRSKAAVFALMFIVQFVYYTNLSVNIRAVSAANIPAAMTTGAMGVAIMYFLVRRVVKNESWWALAGMMAGGSIAEAVGIWLTSHWT